MSRLADLLAGKAVAPRPAPAVAPTKEPDLDVPVSSKVIQRKPDLIANHRPITSPTIPTTKTSEGAAVISALPPVPVTKGTALPTLTKKVGGLVLKNVQKVPVLEQPQDAMIQEMANIPVASIKLTTDVTDWPESDEAAGHPYGVAMAQQLREQLDNVASKLNTSEVSDALNHCLQFIADNKNMEDYLLPEDMGMLLEVLKRSEGVVIAKKMENKKKGKERNDKVVAAADDLAALGF